MKGRGKEHNRENREEEKIFKKNRRKFAGRRGKKILGEQDMAIY